MGARSSVTGAGGVKRIRPDSREGERIDGSIGSQVILPPATDAEGEVALYVG